MLSKSSYGILGSQNSVFHIPLLLVVALSLLSTVLAQIGSACRLSPISLSNPDSTCQSVFRLPGAPPSRLHYVTDGSHAWVAAKFAYLPGNDAIEYFGSSLYALPSQNYHVSRALLVAIANVSSDILMAEADSFVYANMVSSYQYQRVRNNILSDCAWFSATHNSSTLQAWMSPMAPGFNIPDAQQSLEASCEGMYAASVCGQGGSQYVFDSCENPLGSKLHLAHPFRMRCSSASANCSHVLNASHSIWFRIPMTYRSVCDDSVGHLLSTSPASAPMTTFSTVTISGASFSMHAKYSCVFWQPLLLSKFTLIRAHFVNESVLLCRIVDDFVAPDQDLPIGIEQEICSGGTCTMCPVSTSPTSLQTHSAFYLAFSFSPSLLKPVSAIYAVFGSTVSIPVAGGYLNAAKNCPVFPVATVLLEDSEGVSMLLSSVYAPDRWPMGALEFVVPEWPNESTSIRLTAFANTTGTIMKPLYCKESINITLSASWQSAFPLEISDISRQINISGSGFVKIRSYSCVFSPLFDHTDTFAPSISVVAHYVSVKSLRCMFSASAGRYRLNVNENGIAIFKSGAFTDVIFNENVLSMAPTQMFASGANFSLTVVGTGFDQISLYECVIAARERTTMSSTSAVVVKGFVEASSSSAFHSTVVCLFSPWIHTSGTFELRLINRRFNRYVGGSNMKFLIMPIWTSIIPSSSSNLISSIVTISGYGLPSSLYIEATFRSAQYESWSAKSLTALPQSPFRVVLKTPEWYFSSLTAVVELSIVSSSTSILFSGISRAFAFVTVPPTLNFSPSIFDCGSPFTLDVFDTRRFLTNGSGYECQLFNEVSQVIVPAVYTAETIVQCRFGSWLPSSVPSTLQLLYYGSKVAISRAVPLCKHKLSSISPSSIISGLTAQITVTGSFIDINLKYSCSVSGAQSEAIYPNPSTQAVICTIQAPKTSSVMNTYLTLVANDVHSDAVPLAIQPSWKSLYPSVVCLNTKTLLTVTGALFSQNNTHELVFNYQIVDMVEYLKNSYKKPFPLTKSSVVSMGIEVIGSTTVVFAIPTIELLNAIEIQVSMRINKNLIPVESSANSQQFSLPFFTSAAEFSPDQLKGVIGFYDAHDLGETCEPPCRWNPRAGTIGALLGSAIIQNGSATSPIFTSEFSTKIVSSNPSTLIVGFVLPYKTFPFSQQFVVSHGSLPSRSRMARWSSNFSSSLHWSDDFKNGTGLYSILSDHPGPVYWVGSYANGRIKQSLNTADHFQDMSDSYYPTTLNTTDSHLLVGHCQGLDIMCDSSNNFKGGIKFIILIDRELTSQEHLNVARWAKLTHDMPILSRSNSSYMRPWGIFPGVQQSSFSSCSKLVSDVNNNVPACKTYPLGSIDESPTGSSCISANHKSFRLSLASGHFARSASFQGENWLADPASSFMCEVSSVSGYHLSAVGNVISAIYPITNTSNHRFFESNFIDDVVIECDVTSYTLPSSLANDTFRYRFFHPVVDRTM
jgi:hypothetical protein